MFTTWADIPRNHRRNWSVVDEEKASKPFDNEQYSLMKSQRLSTVVEREMRWREGDLLLRARWTAGHEVEIDNYVDPDGNRTWSAYGHIVGAGPTFIRVCWVDDDDKVQIRSFFRTGRCISPDSEQIRDVCQNGMNAMAKFDYEDEKVDDDGETKEINWFQQWRS